MNLPELRQYLTPSWPAEIYIGDGFPTGVDGFRFPNLNEIQRKVDANINYESDNWGAVGHWAIFQALHKLSKKALSEGVVIIKISDIPDELLDYYVHQNISGEGWEIERESYKNSPNPSFKRDA
ncbi:MAG TPA: hypothetical protein VES38_00260 [Methylotenera sp.]|nr:hypothetical protein [Methylotenera sp.]